jgi:hypothetical protein
MRKRHLLGASLGIEVCSVEPDVGMAQARRLAEALGQSRFRINSMTRPLIVSLLFLFLKIDF